MNPEVKAYVITFIVVIAVIFALAKLLEIAFSKKYYCTQCGAVDVRSKTKSNYGCIMSGLDLLFLVGAIFTFGASLIGCLLIHCCVRRVKVCRECGCENCLVPMNSPTARMALDPTAARRSPSRPCRRQP